jgi:phosphatidylglycerophosphate synthase
MKAPFREATRELQGLTAGAEKKALWWLAGKMPPAINSDHLTLLGLLAMAGAGAAYALARVQPWLLLVVNVFLLLNWFGDSLDGTLARFRDRCRPRYGFYVDHIVDVFGALFLLAGLGASGYMSPGVAVALLLAYYLVSINMYLSTYTLGVFKISYGAVGGTELRILLALANLVVLWTPRVRLLGHERLLFDLFGVLASAALAAVLLVTTVKNTHRLYELERI